MRVPFAILGLASLALAGCSIPQSMDTDYGKMGLTGGFSEKEVEPGVWRVLGRSNGVARRGFGRDMAVYRAAEIMQLQGYSSFYVIDQEGKQRSMSYGGGSPSSTGEYFKVWIVGDDGGDAPECRADNPSHCMKLDVAGIMAILAPRLEIDPAMPVRPIK